LFVIQAERVNRRNICPLERSDLNCERKQGLGDGEQRRDAAQRGRSCGCRATAGTLVTPRRRRPAVSICSQRERSKAAAASGAFQLAASALNHWHQHRAGSPRVPRTVRTSSRGASATGRIRIPLRATTRTTASDGRGAIRRWVA
jgi:hypothetical protein